MNNLDNAYENSIVEMALRIHEQRVDNFVKREDNVKFDSPDSVKVYARKKFALLGGDSVEGFMFIMLDNNHRIIAKEVRFNRMIRAFNNSNYLIRMALENNASAVVVVCNSLGDAIFSRNDEKQSVKFKKELEQVGIRMLDFILVANDDDAASLAEFGKL